MDPQGADLAVAAIVGDAVDSVVETVAASVVETVGDAAASVVVIAVVADLHPEAVDSD